MKKSVFVFLGILLCGPSFSSGWNEVMYYRGRSLGNTPHEQIKKSKEILSKAKILLDESGTKTSRVYYKDNAGNSYEALRIVPYGENPLNREARRVEKELSGLPLVFSPYDLSRSRANAFFDSDGSKIGVSYRFVEGDSEDPSYLHELQHAMTYKSVLRGRNFLWAGVIKAPFGKYISSKNTSYYESFASLDEVVATSLSIMLDVAQIGELRRTSSPVEFNRSRGLADTLLNEIYHSIRAGKFLAKQVEDISERALEMAGPKTLSVDFVLGKEKKKVFTTLFQLDAYGREFRNGKGVVVSYPKETEWKLYWPTNYSNSELRGRLMKLNRAGRELAEKFERVEGCIDILIEYPQIEKTDFKCLENNARIPFLTFQNY